MKVRYEVQQASQKREQLNKTFQWLKQIFSSLTFIEKWRYSRWAISRRDVYTKWPDTRLELIGWNMFGNIPQVFSHFDVT